VAPQAAPTLPAILSQAIAEALPAPANLDGAALPSGREVAASTIAALNQVQSARLVARLPNGHRTDLIFVAPDRAALIERDPNEQEVARYVIIADSGYTNTVSTGTGWRHVVNDGFRRQSQIFRPLQVAMAIGRAQPLESGAEVEVVDANGRRGLRALFEYGSSAELEALGLMRTSGNLLEVVVDPTTWLPIRTREETQGSVTEVSYLEYDQPLAVEAPTS
jgi:hypothetical protein